MPSAGPPDAGVSAARWHVQHEFNGWPDDRGLKFRTRPATAMKISILSMMLAGVLVVCAIDASAAPPRSAPTPPPVSHPANLEQAVRQVQHQTRGHILAADTVSRGQTNVYRIKVLTPQGKVQVMQLHSSPQAQGHSSKSRSDQGGH
ncbi:MAG: hypothetical protein KGK35_10170 [Xanthomonadaceae bacterium]|nr:hypothetical protein [Xanthomonadaceae bacterium]